MKVISTPEYNRLFDSSNGRMLRWGRTLKDDPSFSPVGCEIADVEISSRCPRGCAFCYKSNRPGYGENMSLDTFAMVLDKLKGVDQIALGIGGLLENPDLWNIMALCRKQGVVPNLTINGEEMNPDLAARLASLCGAVAVSHYDDAKCFNAVKALTDAGLKQVNIHKLLSAESYNSCFELIDKVTTDPRLSSLKAVVFLLLKPKGWYNKLRPMRRMDQYKRLLDYAKGKGVAVGMDSCSAPMALRSLPESCIPSVEGCESGLFSIYCDVKGDIYPCSFTPGTPGWETGIHLADVKDFLTEVWNGERLSAWRSRLLASSQDCACSLKQHCRSCPLYDLTICKPVAQIRECI